MTLPIPIQRRNSWLLLSPSNLSNALAPSVIHAIKVFFFYDIWFETVEAQNTHATRGISASFYICVTGWFGIIKNIWWLHVIS